jgi:hypothetical protein
VAANSRGQDCCCTLASYQAEAIVAAAAEGIVGFVYHYYEALGLLATRGQWQATTCQAWVTKCACSKQTLRVWRSMLAFACCLPVVRRVYMCRSAGYMCAVFQELLHCQPPGSNSSSSSSSGTAVRRGQLPSVMCAWLVVPCCCIWRRSKYAKHSRSRSVPQVHITEHPADRDPGTNCCHPACSSSGFASRHIGNISLNQRSLSSGAGPLMHAEAIARARWWSLAGRAWPQHRSSCSSCA